MNLGHLDTFIAFALVMLGLSLLVTIAVQGVNVAMQNRGNLLRWGLMRFLEHAGMSPPKARALATNILSDPALSPNGKRFVTHLNFDELLLLLPRYDSAESDLAERKLDLFGRFTSGVHDLLDAWKPGEAASESTDGVS